MNESTINESTINEAIDAPAESTPALRRVMPRHGTDVVSLLAGLLFVGLAAAFLTDALSSWTVNVRWLPAIFLIAVGLSSIASALRRSTERE